jgi:pimeloyl-ACP methyl ester carboxylesterase
MNFVVRPRFKATFVLLPIITALVIGASSPISNSRIFLYQRNVKRTFEPADCMFNLPVGVIAGEEIECGYLNVPENHSNPNGPVLRLAVAIIKARGSNPNPDPLVMAQGGPGGSTIETYAETLLSNRDFVPNRDIVLFDQRGTKYSSPHLYCTEIDKLIAETVEKNLSDAEDEKLSLEAIQACKTRLAGENINLAAFNSLENAADIEALRQALGYKQINLYGVSYGTLLALHYLEMYPQSLRSVILDGVVPPQTNFILNSARTMDQDFTKLFDACKAQSDCNKNYPDLEKVFFKLVDDLNKNPATIVLTDKETNTTYSNAVIDGDTFMGDIFQMLYIGSIIPSLPRMIYDAKNGDFEFFQRLYSILLFDRSMSLGMYYSVICAEEANFTQNDQDLTGVRPQIAKSESREPRLILDTCKIWDVNKLGPTVDKPIQSDVPTLLLSGGFDPITPASYAEEAARTLSKHYAFVFPAGGHGQALEGNCQNGIIQEFLDNPSQTPDGSCITGSSKLTLYTPENTIDIPVLIKALNLEGYSSIEMMVLFLSSLFLLTAFPCVPLIGLLHRLNRRKIQLRSSTSTLSNHNPLGLDNDQPSQQFISKSSQIPVSPVSSKKTSMLNKTAGWAAFFAGPILAIFLSILTFIAINMALNNDNRIFFGISADARLLFVLPLVFLFLSVWMFVADIAAWIWKYWSIWSRIYFTGLTISALVCILILARWDILFALL